MTTYSNQYQNIYGGQPVTSAYLEFPGTNGQYVYTDDSATLSVYTNLQVKFRCSMADYTPSADKHVINKFDGTARTGFAILSKTDGSMQLGWGNGTSTFFVGSGNLGLTDGSVHDFEVRLIVDNGSSQREILWFVDGAQFGATITQAGTTSIADGDEELRIGANNTGFQAGAMNFYSMQVYNDIDGSLVADFDAGLFEDQDSDTDTMTDSLGNLWTINGANITAHVPRTGGGYTPPPPSRRLASPYTRERKGNPFKGFSV